MAFDAEGYRKAAKAAGISDDEIEKDIAEEMGSIKPINATPQKSDVQIGGEYDYLLPAAIGAGVGLGVLGAGAAAKSIKDRWMSKPEIQRIEPSMDQSRYAGPGRIEPTFEAVPVKTEAPPVSPYSEAEQEMLRRSAENSAAKAKEAAIKEFSKAGAVPASVQPAAVPPAAPLVPPAQPTVTQAVAAGQNPTPAIQTEVAKQIDTTLVQTDQPVEPPKNKGGRPSKAAKEEQLKGGVFKEGFGGADNWMQSQVGHDIRRFIRDEFNAGKPYGGGQAAMEKAYSDVNRYEQWLKENIPVQTLNKSERKALGVPNPEPYGSLGKAMKVGGVAGLLMTASQAANAKQAMQNVGEALLPIGLTPSELASGTLTEKQFRAFQEAQKLGSPYRSVPPPR